MHDGGEDGEGGRRSRSTANRAKNSFLLKGEGKGGGGGDLRLATAPVGGCPRASEDPVNRIMRQNSRRVIKHQLRTVWSVAPENGKGGGGGALSALRVQTAAVGGSKRRHKTPNKTVNKGRGRAASMEGGKAGGGAGTVRRGDRERDDKYVHILYVQ